MKGFQKKSYCFCSIFQCRKILLKSKTSCCYGFCMYYYFHQISLTLQLSQFFSSSGLAELQGPDDDNCEAANNPITSDSALYTKEMDTGNTSDSSLGSIDSLRLNLQDFTSVSGSQVMNSSPGSNAMTPSYVMTPEERRRSIEQVLKTSFADRRPSMKDLAEWKILYEHGRRSPRPLPSVGKNNLRMILIGISWI